MDSDANIGVPSDAELRSVIDATDGNAAEAGTPIETRFARSVAALLSTRANKDQGMAAFVLWRTTSDPEFKTVLVPLLRFGNDDLGGRLWIVSQKMGVSSRRLETKYADAETLFGALKEFKLETYSTIVVDWRSGQADVMLFPAGIADSDNFYDLTLESEPIGADKMKEVLDKIYNDFLRTPLKTRQGFLERIWIDAPNGIPEQRPEERIHGKLFVPLKTLFPNHQVKSETPTEEGRADLSVYALVKSEHGHKSRRTDWLLELKAVCDKTYTGQKKTSPTCSEAMIKGIQQILAYRKSLEPLQSALCCYDMCLSDEGDSACFVDVTEKATEENVHLWRWYLYRSSDSGRVAEFPL